MDQHQPDAAILRGALDLGETVGGGGIDAGDELEVEQQEAAFRMTRQQRLDVLVEPVGRAEEQIALQVQALDLAAMRRQAPPGRRASDPANCDIRSRRN